MGWKNAGLHPSAERQEPTGVVLQHLLHALCIIAEAVGVFLLGVYIQTHQGGCGLYIYIYVHTYRGLLLFLCGDLHLHFGKLDADLSPTVTGGQGHATPL